MEYMDLLNKIAEFKIECEEDLYQIDKLLEELNISFKYEGDCAYDSCGYDVYYYAYAFMYDGEIRLITGTWDVC